MGKQKKDNPSKGASKKSVKPAEGKKKQEHEENENQNKGGIIGIGMPVDSETLRKMKEQAKKLDH